MKTKLHYILYLLYFFIVIWWLRLHFYNIQESGEVYIFGAVYPLIALIGAANGISIAKKWGGWESSLGKSIYFFSFGLLALWFGQTTWSYYNIIARIEVPYPSLADIGYVAIIPLYALGSLYLGQASGAGVGIKKNIGKTVVVLTSFIVIFIAYSLFFRNLSLDLSEPVRSFLDLMYSFGEAVTISITISVFILSYPILGGRMRGKVLYLIFALVAQYVTDYTFLYMAANGSYYNGGIVDLMYATSFLITSIGLINLRSYK